MDPHLLTVYSEHEKKHASGKLDYLDLLSAILEFNYYINAECSAADELRYTAKRMDTKAEVATKFRDVMLTWKEEIKK